MMIRFIFILTTKGIRHLLNEYFQLIAPFTLIVYVAAKYPCNHGDGPWLWVWLAASVAVVALVDWLVNRMSLVGGAISVIICLSLVFACDRLNMLVHYDVWLSRGMPDDTVISPDILI